MNIWTLWLSDCEFTENAGWLFITKKVKHTEEIKGLKLPSEQTN